MISLQNITKFYEINGQKGRNVIDNLSLKLPEKGLVVIFGASGCGKSTLLNIIGGLDFPCSGNLIVSGRNTNNFSSSDWDAYRNQEVGFIFQNYYLMPHLTVYENIAITLQMCDKTDNIRAKIEDSLKAVGMLDYKNRLPKTLSGGQQQRVAIARALISNPSVILADEPTGALDEENAKSVMDNLKEISKDHLVVLVTHNERLAKEYADRFIELSYGTIKSDSLKDEIPLDINNKNHLTKTHLPFITNLKWSFKNVWKKKSRTIPTIAASTIGFMAIGIVVSMTIQVNQYTKDAQSASLNRYPVYVMCYSSASAEAHSKNLVEFPTDPYIIVEKYDYEEQNSLPIMQKEFSDYMEQMPEEYYVGSASNSTLNFQVLTKTYEDEYKSVSATSYFQKTPINYEFVKSQYDVITGTLPTNKNEVVLLVDSYNRLDAYDLGKLGYDTSVDTISFDDILGKEFRIIPNNSYYIKKRIISPATQDFANIYTTHSTSEYGDLYNDSTSIPIKIVGIVRPKSSDMSLFYNPILYTEELSNYLKEVNGNSDIVTDQLSYAGCTKDNIRKLTNEDKVIEIYSGNYIERQESSTYPLSVNYQFEYILYYLGMKDICNAIYYYTDDFESRYKIQDYYNAFKPSQEDEDIVLSYKDYIEQVTNEFSGMVDVFSGVVFVFCLIAILISVILTATLTYITVLERTREIGLLRSLGARRIDVSRLFITESGVCGLFGGFLAVIGCFVFSPSAGIVVKSLVSMFNSSIMSKVNMTFNKFIWWVGPIVFVSAILVNIIAALIPALIAGRKKPADILKE